MTTPRKPTATERGVAIVLVSGLVAAFVAFSGWCAWDVLTVMFAFRRLETGTDITRLTFSIISLIASGFFAAFQFVENGIPWLHWALTTPVAKSAETFDAIDEGRL